MCESLRETLDVLSDDEALADLLQFRDDFAAGDTFEADLVYATWATLMSDVAGKRQSGARRPQPSPHGARRLSGR